MKKYYWVYATILMVALILSACGGTAAPEASSEEPDTAGQEAATSDEAATAGESEAAGADSSSPDAGLANELSVYNWADYIDEELLTKYEEEYGVK